MLGDFVNCSQKFLKYCPNTSHLSNDELSNIIDGNEVICKKLKSIEFQYSPEDYITIEKFIDSNINNLQSIRVRVVPYANQNDVYILFKSLQRLSGLNSIFLDYSSILNINLLINFFKELSKNSLHLKKIELFVRYKYFQNLFQSMNFKYLTTLSLDNSFDLINQSEITSQELNKFENYKHLKLILNTNAE